MIEIQKKPLYNRPTTCLVAIVFILVGLFSYAIFVDHRYFIFLSASLIIIISYLIPLRFRAAKKQASVALQVQDLSERSNMVSEEIKKEEQACNSFRSKIVNYSQLKGLTERLSMCLYLEDTSKTLSTEVNRLFGEKNTTIILYLFHSKTGELGISSSQKGQMKINIRSKKGDIFDQWIVKTMQPLLVEDTKSDYRFDEDKIETEEVRPIRSLISIPLCVGNKALGILRIDSPEEDHFNTEDLRFLTTIGDLGAVAIENAQLYERVEQLAIKDSLTDLYLRRYLNERMPEEISRHMRRKGQLSFMLIDLDHFKKYNDKFGHVAGDIVLKTVGGLLNEFFNQPGMLICRYGGEEFCVLLPDCTKKKAEQLAEEIRVRISKEIIILRREKTKVTVSIGVATFPKDARMKEELVHKADLALYKAKSDGRNRVHAA